MPKYSEIVEYIKLAQKKSKFCISLLGEPKEEFDIVNECVYQNGKLFVSEFYVTEFFDIQHEHGEGTIQLRRKINRIDILVKNKYEFATEFIRACETCNQVLSSCSEKNTRIRQCELFTIQTRVFHWIS